MPEFKENQGFKMKGPSMHKGTQGHIDALNAERNARIKIQKADIDYKMNSPAKGIFGGEFKNTAAKIDKKIEKQKKKIEKPTKGQNKRYQKWLDKNKMSGDAETQKQWQESQEGKKSGNWLSRTATRAKKGLQKGKLARLEKKKAKLAAKEAMTPEQKLAKKQERKTRIADTLEYIFLDGKRPDKLAMKRKAKMEKDAKKNQTLENKDKHQNKNTQHDPDKKDFKTDKIWDPKNPDTNMKDFAIGSEERKAEYDRRKWKYDETIKGYNKDGTKKK